METIFDHNINERELEFVTGFPDTTKEEYTKCANTRDLCYRDLYYLYLYRKQEEKAKIYYDKITDNFNKYFSIGKFDIDLFD